jgi:hypothetical protein
MLCRWTDEATHGILKPVWRKALYEAGVAAKWNGEESYDEFPNGSRAYIRGLRSQDQVNRYAKFRGLTLARIYVDQAEEIPRDIYLELAARLSQQGYAQQITISPNAIEETHWIADEFPADNSKPERKYISLSVYDNAHNLPESVIPALLRLYPVEHPKHRTMVLGQRGMNVIGEPVYKGMFVRQLHVGPTSANPELPLEEAIDFGKHCPCVVWRQTTPLGGVVYLGGIMGDDLYLEDFLPLILAQRKRWFPDISDVKTTCDPAGSHNSSQGVRENGVSLLRKAGLAPRFIDNANAPDVRLAMVERHAGLMRRRTSAGEAFRVDDRRWLLVSANSRREFPFLADGFEAGYVWDDHLISVGNKQVRKPKKDGWYEHGQNCAEYLELAFGGYARRPKAKSRSRVMPARPSSTAWMG